MNYFFTIAVWWGSKWGGCAQRRPEQEKTRRWRLSMWRNMHSSSFPCVISKGRVSHLHTLWVTPTTQVAECSSLSKSLKLILCHCKEFSGLSVCVQTSARDDFHLAGPLVCLSSLSINSFCFWELYIRPVAVASRTSHFCLLATFKC